MTELRLPPADSVDEALIRESIDVPERFAPLFDRHAAAVHRYLSRRIGEPADDLLAETFLVAFRRRTSFEPIRLDARAWLFGIATNVLRRHVRQEERRYRAMARSAGLVAHVHVDEPTDDRLDAQALRAALAAALAALKPPDRDALLLLAWAELTYAEIAAALGIPLGTVRSRINRARRLTRSALDLPEEP
ncbi:RNA polymerase sigma-70 factor (ECF subfamily) [Hamadaea flava]|uniref:RNA polymerase sigma factor n=1 Tax=Hamadaea flava TaxID=1742688 RepID=A0ABV8M060_9ACTN|nr:sigma-70 family RNA polymerase sigma factor [Hamadaea flava]MCP2329041.1 RNA polymerase sigma-70 factor (ECF subfamily) [Hamadaea flava]